MKRSDNGAEWRGVRRANARGAKAGETESETTKEERGGDLPLAASRWRGFLHEAKRKSKNHDSGAVLRDQRGAHKQKLRGR